MVQARWQPDARDYLTRKRAKGKTAAGAQLCLKRHLAAVIFRARLRDITHQIYRRHDPRETTSRPLLATT